MSRCLYCGAPTHGLALACRAHLDVAARDPQLTTARGPSRVRRMQAAATQGEAAQALKGKGSR